MGTIIQLATLRLPAAYCARANEVFGQLPRIYIMTERQEKLLNKILDRFLVPVSLPGVNIVHKEFCQAQAIFWFIKLAKAGKAALEDNPEGQLMIKGPINPPGQVEGYIENNTRHRVIAGELACIMHKIDKELECNECCLEDPMCYRALSIELWNCFYDISNWYSVGAFGKGTLESELEKSIEGKSYLEFWYKNGRSGLPGEEILDSTLKKSFSGRRCLELDAVGNSQEVCPVWDFASWKEALPPGKNAIRWQKDRGEVHVKIFDDDGNTVMDTENCKSPHNCILVDLRKKTLELVPLRAILSTSMTWNRKEHAHLIVAYLKHVSASFGKGEAVFSPTYWYSVVRRTDSIPQPLQNAPSKAKGPKSQISIHDGRDYIHYHTETKDKRIWKYDTEMRFKIASYLAHLSDIFVSHKGSLPSPFEWENAN